MSNAKIFLAKLNQARLSSFSRSKACRTASRANEFYPMKISAIIAWATLLCLTMTLSADEKVWDGWRGELGLRFRSGSQLNPGTRPRRFYYVQVKNESGEKLVFAMEAKCTSPKNGLKLKNMPLKAGETKEFTVSMDEPLVSLSVAADSRGGGSTSRMQVFPKKGGSPAVVPSTPEAPTPKKIKPPQQSIPK